MNDKPVHVDAAPGSPVGRGRAEGATDVEAAAQEPPWLSVGAGRSQPRCRRAKADSGVPRVLAVATALNDLVPGEEEQWVSCHLWKGDYRSKENWEAADCFLNDIDFIDAAGKHSAMTEVDALRFEASAREMGTNILHRTPRGFRLGFVPARRIVDRETALGVMRGACAFVSQKLRDLALDSGPGRAGFVVDEAASTDLARLFFSPKAVVGGIQRESAVVVLRRTPVDIEKFCGLVQSAPVSATGSTEAQAATTSRRPEATSSFMEAKGKWLEDHPSTWPSAVSTMACPTCLHEGCFHGHPTDPTRWTCFSTNHERDSDGCGRRAGDGSNWFGDALDIEVNLRRMPAAKILLEDGYLVNSKVTSPTVTPRVDGLGTAAPAVAGVQSGNGNKPRTHRRLLSWVPFPIALLPRVIARFVRETASAIGCDPIYVVLPVLAVLAAAIGNSRRIRLKRDWTEPAVIWSVVVGDSGTLKSPAQEAASKPLDAVELRAVKKFMEAMAKYQEETQVYERDVSRFKKGGISEPPAKPERPTLVRFRVSDTTLEALCIVLANNPRGILLERDELSAWLGSLNQYRGGRGGDVGQYLQAHRAGRIIVDRKNLGPVPIIIARGAISISGGIQPDVLRDCLSEEHFANGMAARFLMANPPRRQRKWRDTDASVRGTNDYATVVANLLDLPMAMGTEGEPIPVDLPLDSGGQAAFKRFYKDFAERQNLVTGAAAAALSKLEGGAARLALIFQMVRAASEGASGDCVDEQSVVAAAGLARWFADETERVYETLLEGPAVRGQRQLAELIKSRGGHISVRELQKGRWTYRHSAEAAKQALDDLVKAGYGTWRPPETTSSGGRPTEVFELAPESSIDIDKTSDLEGDAEGSVDVDEEADPPVGDGWVELA